MGHQVAGFSDVELVAVLREDEVVVRDRRARQLALIAEAERRGLPTESGSRSTTVWVRDLLKLADDEAKSLVMVARAVEDRTELSGMPLPPDLPATAGALNDGAISVAHARVIVDGVATLPTSTTRNQRYEAESLLAAEAHTLSPRQVRTLAERIRYHLDQDGALREEQHHLATRELHFGVGRDGMTVLSGRLDRETGAKLRAALEPLAAPVPSDDGQRDPRSAGKRHADAFADLLDLALGVTGLPRTGGQRPHLSISIDFAQLQHDISTDQLGAGGTITTTGQPITTEHARRIACDAEILPIVLGGHSQPLDVGRAQRSAPPHLRAALHARDGRCAFPGCDHPPGTSEATTFGTGPTVVPPAWTTWSCCADTTTAPSTPNTGKSPSPPDNPCSYRQRGSTPDEHPNPAEHHHTTPHSPPPANHPAGQKAEPCKEKPRHALSLRVRLLPALAVRASPCSAAGMSSRAGEVLG